MIDSTLSKQGYRVYMLNCSCNTSNMLPSRLILGGPLWKPSVTQTKYPAELSKRPVKNYGFACGKRANKQFPETLQGSAKRQGLGCVNSLPGSVWL